MLVLLLAHSIERLRQLHGIAERAGARTNCLDCVDVAHSILQRYPKDFDLVVVDLEGWRREQMARLPLFSGPAMPEAPDVLVVSDRPIYRRSGKSDPAAAALESAIYQRRESLSTAIAG